MNYFVPMQLRADMLTKTIASNQCLQVEIIENDRLGRFVRISEVLPKHTRGVYPSYINPKQSGHVVANTVIGKIINNLSLDFGFEIRDYDQLLDFVSYNHEFTFVKSGMTGSTFNSIREDEDTRVVYHFVMVKHDQYGLFKHGEGVL